MVKNSDRKLYKLFEELIKATRIIEYYPYNKSVDFSIGDIVQCSYIGGYFKVIGKNSHYITIDSIPRKEKHLPDFSYVSAAFLKKIQLNPQVMEVLFDEKD